MKTKQNNRFGILLGLRGVRLISSVLFYVFVIAGIGYVLLFGNSQVARADYLANEFVTVWKTDNPGVSASNQVTIPTYLGETYNYNVAWEEVGNPGNSGTAGPFVGDAVITFPSAGSYEVRITGLFPRIQVQDLNAYTTGALTDSGKLLEIKQWGNNQWTSMNSAFVGAKNMTVTAVDVPDLSNVTDVSFMFAGATAFNQPLNSWDVSNVTTMDYTFAGATAFNQPLNNWDVSSVTDVSFMFAGATAFNQPLNNWDVSSVTDVSFMFAGATAFNQPLNNWDVSSVTDVSFMFAGATAFNQPLNNWDVSSVLTMQNMFSSATSFNQDISNWDVSSVTTVSFVFTDAKSFNQPLNNWDVSSVTDMQYMFAGATAFNQPLNNWDVSSVTDVSFMFAGATAFNQPLNNWDVSSVTDVSFMFAGATAFNQPLNNWDVSSVLTMQNMFSSATSFNQDISNWDVSSVTTVSFVFTDAKSFNQPLNNWDVSSVTDMQYMFAGAISFNQPLDNWDTSNVTNMSNMFRDADAFNQPLNNWDVSSVTDMQYMFAGAGAFNQPLNTWDVRSVTNLYAMFYYATNFNQPLGTWNVENVTEAAFFLLQTSISPANYDNLLDGWSKLTLKSGVRLWIGTGYCNAGSQRATIIANFGWGIGDHGNFCPPDVVITTKNFNSTVYMQGIPLSIEIQTANAFNSNATFTVVAGSLPRGLQLTGIGGGKGQISGTPTTPGRYTFTVQVYDGNSYSTQEYTITILASTPIQSGESTSTDSQAQEEPKPRAQVSREGGDVESASTVESGINSLANRLGVAPQTIVNTAPWVIIVLLLVFTTVTGIRIIQQVHVAIKNKLLAERLALLNHEKRSLLTLVTHYLRTPITIMSADVDTLPQDYETLKLAKADLGSTIEQIVTGIEGDLSKVESEDVSQQASYKRSILNPKVLIPVVVTSALVVVINILIFTTTKFDPALINLGAQFVGFLIVSSLFYISFSQYQQHKEIKNNQLHLVKHQEKLDSARNEFIGDVVEKLIPAVEHVENSIPDELDTEHAKYLHEGLRQLKKVTDNFDLISKLDSGKLMEQAGKVSLAKTLRIVRDQQSEPGTISIKAEPRLNLKQPEFLLNKVLSTVLDNAVVHNKPETKTVISARKVGRKVKIDIKDHGDGIPKEKLDLLFKPLSRVESAEDFTHQGMGLSLYINSLIMHYLGGDITVKSKVGEGTTVHLELPRTKSGRI